MNSDNAPVISIGMPVYNGEEYLDETIQSILSQTYGNFEFIISDNASTDRTQELCEQYAVRDQRITYHRYEENRGAAWNYNNVFKLARGKYFKWAASDDLIDPHYLECTANILDTREDYVLAYTKARIIDGNSNVIKDYDDHLHIHVDEPYKRLKQFLYLVGECNAVFGLVRRDILQRTHLIGNFISSDTTLLAELSLYGKFYEVPEQYFFRREHKKASSWDKSEENQLEFFDPQLLGKIVFPISRRFFEDIKSVHNSTISTMDKIRCYHVLLKYFIHTRDKFIAEWKRAARKKYYRLKHRHETG